MNELPLATLIHLSFLLSIKEKCILYESSNYTGILEYLTRIIEIKHDCSNKLTHEILNQPRFRFLKVLEFHDIQNTNITDLNQFADTLEELNITNSYGLSKIKDEGIVKLLKLKKLNIFHNQHIHQLNHFINLTHIDIGSYYCGVSDDGIPQLRNLESIRMYANYNITKLKHFTKLKEISIGGYYFNIHDEISSLLFLEKIRINDMDYSKLKNKELIVIGVPITSFYW